MTTTGPLTEHGHAFGLATARGFPLDSSEWTPELTWPLNIAVYDRMRRQDAKVKSVLNAVTLPIRRTPWRIAPNGAPDAVARFIADDLGIPVVGDKDANTRPRDRGRFSWPNHLRLALLELAYGHMPFEKVGDIADDGLWHLTKLAERLPPTIARINVARSGDLESIDQYPTGLPGDAGPFDTIDASALVFYSHEREGGQWQGNSILRSAYKNWLLKDRLIKIDAIKHDRNGLGVPGFEAPENASSKVLEQLQQLASAFRAGETSGMAWPAGAKFSLTGVTGSLPDTLGSIRYHDEQIAEEALAQFLELGQSAHGSRALGSAFIDFFIMSLQAVADEIETTVNTQLIEEWVDWNWGSDVPAPRVVCDEIGNQTALTAEAIAGLVDSGALVADASIDAYLRENFRLPDRSGALNPPPPAHEGNGLSIAAGRRRRPFLAASPANIENAPAWAGAPYLTKLTGHYTDDILDALTFGLDVDQLDLEAIAAASLLPADERLAALADVLPLDTAALVAVFDLLLGDAWLAGYHVGDLAVIDADRTATAVKWETSIDWSAWTPGDPDAAALLRATKADTGLARLLEDAGATIDGITDATLDQLGNLIADGVTRGDSTATTATAIRGLVGDRARAEKIAQTETARAITVATLDSYQANGVTGREWLLSDGACPLCEENEADGVIALDDEFTNGDPPVHPFCVCAIAPVFADGSTGDGEDA